MIFLNAYIPVQIRVRTDQSQWEDGVSKRGGYIVKLKRVTRFSDGKEPDCEGLASTNLVAKAARECGCLSPGQ